MVCRKTFKRVVLNKPQLYESCKPSPSLSQKKVTSLGDLASGKPAVSRELPKYVLNNASMLDRHWCRPTTYGEKASVSVFDDEAAELV